ncbi:hypothetical protein JTB14_029985 [Gonioctena quinquepunctata]|nr:hypothetical protein JTB14_029985 [Gonioctena quinquepunctata]
MLEIQDLREFSISTWYNKFKHVTLDTIIIDLPNELLTRIQSDGINDDSEEEGYINEVNIIEEAGSLSECSEQFKNAMNLLVLA